MPRQSLTSQVEELKRRVALLEEDNKILAEQALNYKLASLEDDEAIENDQRAEKALSEILRAIERIAAVAPPPWGTELKRIVRDGWRELEQTQDSFESRAR